MRPSYRDIAILLMAMGGPSVLEEVEGFLGRLLGGRLPSKERIKDVRRRYRLIGGGSPLPAITMRQAQALEAELARRGQKLPVFTGMRFSKPSVAEAVAHMFARGIRRLIALPLALYRSKLSTEPYFAALEQAMANQNARFSVFQVTGWHTHPLFVEALEEKIGEGLSRFAPDVKDTVQVIFSAHSLPERAVCDDPYVEDIHETIKAVLERFGPLAWRLGFQSQGGGSESWLGPDVGEVLEDLSRRGCPRVLVVPLGFVSDHLETLYDLDIKYRKQAEALGMEYQRSPSLNDSPRFIQALAEVVLERLEKLERSQEDLEGPQKSY